MHKIFMAVIAASLMASAAYAQDDVKFDEVGPWWVNKDIKRNICYALYARDDDGLFVEYDAKTGKVFLRVSNGLATSISDNQTVKLKIDFVSGNNLDDGWGEGEFLTFVSKDGARLFNSGPFNRDILDDIAKQDYLALMYGDKIVGGAKLDKSAAMVAKLRECSISAAGLNPRDPFLP